MRHPNPQRCHELAMLFLFLHEEGVEKSHEYFGDDNRNQVAMMQAGSSPCGTSACHAGWFSIASAGDVSPNSYLSFEDGMTALTRFVMDGATDRCRDLENWAEDNPRLWGNENGENMFCDGGAFGFRKTEPTLEDIAMHWAAVGDRINELG